MKKNILALETSCPFLSVALATRNGKIKEARTSRRLQHSENLIPFVDKLLKQARLKPDQIDALVIDRGPGSFTGLRIGFSFLQGFRAARKISCSGALSLDSIAERVKAGEGKRLGVLVDARRDRIYSRFYRGRRGKWAPEGAMELVSLPALQEKLEKGDFLTGDALTRYGGTLRGNFSRKIFLLEEKEWYPLAGILARWGQANDPRLAPLLEKSDFLPLYLRPSEAEEKKRTK